MKNPQSNRAFTLVEMAIILVVVGMIVAGVIGGRSLIESSKISSTISQLANYSAAHNSFVLKYDGIPGDFKGAEEYDLHKNSDGVTTACITTWGSAQYFGNGNEFLNSRYGSVTQYDGEIMNYFIHLSNSGLIKETFSRESSRGCSYAHYEGISYPETDIDGGMIVLSDYNDSESQYYFILGGMGASHDARISGPTAGDYQNIDGDYITPKIATKIDRKLDNRNPLTGLVRVIASYPIIVSNYSALNIDTVDDATNCVYNSKYNVSLDEPACTLAVQIRY